MVQKKNCVHKVKNNKEETKTDKQRSKLAEN